MKLLLGKLLAISSILFYACGDDEGDEGGGQVIGNLSRLMSTSLATSLLQQACDGDAVACTPDNIEGRVFAAGALLGTDSDGSRNYNMTFLANDAAIINDPSDPSFAEGTLAFDLADPQVFSGLISIPDEGSMPSPAVISRLETMFDFIDAKFTVAGAGDTELDQTYTVRTVFRKTATASDVADGQIMQWGDKLIKREGETTFKWCSTAGCDHSERPDSPLQQSSIVQAAETVGSQPGNPNYVSYAIDFKQNLTTSYAEISCQNCIWQIDFDVTSAISFTTSLSDIESLSDLVQAFELGYGCNFGGCTTTNDRIFGSLEISQPNQE